MKTEQFDERQTQIRGNVFFRGLLFAMGLVLINAFLQDNGVIWASGFYQNILVFLATTMFVSIEAILRGVFFRHRQTHWPMIGLYGVGGIVIIVYELVKFSQGAVLIENGGLSTKGATFVAGLMFAIAAIVGVSKELSEKRRKSE